MYSSFIIVNKPIYLFFLFRMHSLAPMLSFSIPICYPPSLVVVSFCLSQFISLPSLFPLLHIKPEIEIWNLDVLNVLEPVALLGGRHTGLDFTTILSFKYDSVLNCICLWMNQSNSSMTLTITLTVDPAVASAAAAKVHVSRCRL